MSELFIKTDLLEGRTIGSDSFFTQPLKIAKPFYREDGYTEVMTLLAGPGMLRGDSYNIRYEMSPGTKTLITAQSYQKLYNSTDGETIQKVEMKVGSEAEFCYIPHPAIPFTGNKFKSAMDIDLSPDCKFIFTDILATGREGMGERLSFARYSSSVCVRIDDKPVFLDHTRLFTEEANFDKLGFYEEYNCQGLMYLYGYGDEITLPEYDRVIEVAISKAREGHVIRFLAESADAGHQFSMLLWQSLRT